MGKFIVRNGDLEGRKFRLEAGAKVVLGRELGDLNFPDKRMSRRHCALESRDDGDYLVDMESTNGCWVNNERVKESRLTPGDLVRVGFTELEFLGMPDPALQAAMLAGLVPPGGLSPNQTIAFRRPTGLGPPGEGGDQAVAEPPAGDTTATEPPAGSRGATVTSKDEQPGVQRSRERERVKAAKYAAMGKALKDDRRLISAKGKFCEACGEAIFMKEGAADEGVMSNGLYLCRMCALIAEKQEGLGADYLPSYAKIVGGRMTEMPPDGPPAVAQESTQRREPEREGDFEIVESEEVSLDDLSPTDSERIPTDHSAPAAPSPSPADVRPEGAGARGAPAAAGSTSASQDSPRIIAPLLDGRDQPDAVAAAGGVADTHTDEPRPAAQPTTSVDGAAADALAAALEHALTDALAKESQASARAPQPAQDEADEPDEIDEQDEQDSDDDPIEPLDPDDIVTPRKGESPIVERSSDEPGHASDVEKSGGRPPESFS